MIARMPEERSRKTGAEPKRADECPDYGPRRRTVAHPGHPHELPPPERQRGHRDDTRTADALRGPLPCYAIQTRYAAATMIPTPPTFVSAGVTRDTDRMKTSEPEATPSNSSGRPLPMP
jgi:hypothetical protein